MVAGSAKGTRGQWWHLVLGTIVLLPFAPGSLDLVAPTLAALLVASAAGSRRTRELAIAAVLAGLSLAAIVWPSSKADPLARALSTYSLLAAVAFAGGALLAPAGVLRQAFRAVCCAIAGVGLLGLVVRGAGFWTELHWSALRQTSSAFRTIVPLRPDAYPLLEPLVRFMSDAFPAFVILQTFAGLALAWQWHVRLAQVPLGPSLGAFRDFRFGDQWVWGLVTALLVWAVPKLVLLKGAALNVGLVLGALYLLRGAAILVALAGAAGLPTWTLVAGAVVACVLLLPLLVLVPSLWTLGVFDTWLAFRQRRFGRPTVQ
jgi:predicted membrane protein DUF2232